MTITVTTTDITPGVEATGSSGPTTIVTQDTGDGTQPPVITVVDLDSGEPATIEIAAEPPTVVQVTDGAPTVIEIAEAGIPGPPGIAGPVGPQGIQGPDGGGAEGMVFVMDLPGTEWIIPHGFDYWPSVTVVDTAGNEIETEIYQGLGVVTIRTELATAGRAYLI